MMMCVLSPFFGIGGITVARFLKIRWKYIVALVVLIIYLLSNTGMVYQMFGVPYAITLNSAGQNYDFYFIHDQDSYAAKWLGEHIQGNPTIYIDSLYVYVLISQGMISPFSNFGEIVGQNASLKEGYIFLPYTAVVDGKLLDIHYNWYNITEYQDDFSNRNLLYDNGDSEIYG